MKIDLFNKKFTKGESCWIWSGKVSTDGYGVFKVQGKYRNAHRVSWEMHKGSIPDGLSILHRCDNRRCINPEHLFLGTQRENIRDMVSKERQARGERTGNARLTADIVLAMRELRRQGVIYREIAERFGVAKNTARNAIIGERWGWLQ